MRTRDWYEKSSKQMTEYVCGKAIVSCAVKPQVLHLHFSDGDYLGIMYDHLNDWGLVLPTEDSMNIRQIQRQKQGLADAIKLLIANFAHRTNAVVESIHAQHIPSTSKAWDKHIIDVNISL